MKTILIAALTFAALSTSVFANPCAFKESARLVVKGYDVGTTAVPKDQKSRLAKFAETAKHRFEICIFSQVDKQGSDEANRKVAQARAEAVRKYLIGQGVPAGSIKIAKQDDAITFFGLLSDDQPDDRRVMVTHE